MLAASPPPCMVLHCPDEPSDLRDGLHIEGSDGAWPAYVCATHKSRIDQGEPWLWVPWNRLKGVGSDMSEGCILMGEELAGFGLVVDADVRMSTSLVFSPDRAEGTGDDHVGDRWPAVRGQSACLPRTDPQSGDRGAPQGGIAFSPPIRFLRFTLSAVQTA
jgi:hypothetical protein